MEIKVMKSLSETIGIVRHSEEHGNVKIVGFKENKSWGGRVVIYLDKIHVDNAIGSFEQPGTLTGGAIIVEKTDEPVTVFEKK
ncbi:hypothetical protein [Paenibacillus dakarensis]|uniref:hypothetical protein n=1 Tax=Paenibacillus dakarensis TaxID=1527293 RepID=UPI0006D5779F|nr:hypothetical protein [Paenibacillus dakarensis]